jgi:hypothetical protein
MVWYMLHVSMRRVPKVRQGVRMTDKARNKKRGLLENVGGRDHFGGGTR